MRNSFLSLVKRFAREDRGAAFVEYALLLALVVGGITAVVLAGLTGSITNAFDAVGTALEGSVNTELGND